MGPTTPQPLPFLLLLLLLWPGFSKQISGNQFPQVPQAPTDDVPQRKMQIPELPFATPKALEGWKRWKIIAISTQKNELQSNETQSREN